MPSPARPPAESADAPPGVRSRLFVEPEQARTRVLDLLEQQWPRSDRRGWRKALRDGLITVDGEVVHAQRRLRPGEVVELRLDPDTVPSRDAEAVVAAEPDTVEVLFEDAALLVVDKPAGMHTVPDRGGKYRGVHGLLQDLRPEADLRIVHRLDQGTSGCLVLAKGLDAARALDAAFAAREVEKEYLALVAGVVRRTPLAIRKALGPDRRRPGRIRVVDADSKGAREAHTDLELVAQFRRHALVRARPRTGRSHQIRVHLGAVGHPILGDKDYGPRAPLLLSDLKPGFKLRRGVQEKPLLRRMFLHAASVALRSPAGDEQIRVESPLPSELAMVLAKLTKFAARRSGGPPCD